MTQNILKLNDSKTNILYLVSPHGVKSLKIPAIQIGAFFITKHQEVIFNQSINMDEHVTSSCLALYDPVKNFHCLKTLLTQKG